MIFPLTEQARERDNSRTVIARRCQAVDVLARTFADNLNADALAGLARTVRALEASIEDHRENVRNALAIQREIRAVADRARQDPMGARQGGETL